ncbi:RNA-binding domain-containing protein [Violaceomyces palustris]|uniref:RNA-binding domain-containing protein n=1 Tax=Violaceomyces palustris TaxID=1673888 RepID=A0ACD0P2Y8_9BASI|nr:RNA-binding domain-containing protein [Violaceomyces palustris]
MASNGGTRLYLGRLAPDVRRSDIEDLFKNYGRLLDVRIMGSFGFAEFEHPRDAEDAVKDFDGKNFMGERLVVQPAKQSRRELGGGRDGFGDPYGGGYGGGYGYPPRGGGGYGGYGPPPPRQPPRLRRGQFRLIVSNLPPNTSWQDLKDIGREAGAISFADVDPSRPDEGIIEYDNREDMERALDKIEGIELRGNKLRVDPAEPPRGGRDGRDRDPPPRDLPPRDRDVRDGRDGRDSRDGRDAREGRESRDREPRDGNGRDRERSPVRRREDSREPLPPPRSARYDSRSPPPKRERDYEDRPPRDD